MTKKISILLAVVLAITACVKPAEKTDFVKVNEGRFVVGENNYRFIGTNFWYGAILGSQGEGGNRDRLIKELDLLKSVGINNLRILVGADGFSGVTSKVEPTLQLSPGEYNDEILDGLDFLLSQMKKRDMYAVLYLNNSWEWSGGYSQYLQWAGCGNPPIPAVDGWPAFMEYVKQYATNETAKELFANHVRNIVSRTNRYSGIDYKDDPVIMSWQIGNEPRAFGDENKEPFAKWMSQIAALIRSLDPNHLISTGNEGEKGCEGDIALFERIHSDKNIDYMTIHMWPYNWGWIDRDSIPEKLPVAIQYSKEYIDLHIEVAKRHSKPVVMEEFGFPRDGFSFSKESTTVNRDKYYEAIFSYIHDNINNGGNFAGCNFWAWGGFAKQSSEHIFWEKGDDYTGDPAQEQQGLNSVFSTDESTLRIIKKYSDLLNDKIVSTNSINPK